MAAMWFQANLRHTADISGLYSRIPKDKVSLGGKDGEYTVRFSGDSTDGLLILDEIIKEGHCRVQITCGY